jgi:membrane-bound metal-dependent hydrolase YbcI (DUF457 family)
VFPLGHLSVGLLSYLAFLQIRRFRGRAVVLSPRSLATLSVATQVPDLIDKPLAHVGLLASGRSLGHSLLFALVVVALAWPVARRIDWTELPVVLGVGVVSHALTDAYQPLSAGDWAAARFLLYPLTSPVIYPGEAMPPIGRVLAHYSTLTPGRELWLAGLACVALAWHLWRVTREEPSP